MCAARATRSDELLVILGPTWDEARALVMEIGVRERACSFFREIA